MIYECIRRMLSCFTCISSKEEPILQSQYDAMNGVEIIPYPLESARRME
jgi:hypothetical protein